MRTPILLLATCMILTHAARPAFAEEAAPAVPPAGAAPAADPHAGHDHAAGDHGHGGGTPQDPAAGPSHAPVKLTTAEQPLYDELEKLRNSQPKDAKQQEELMQSAEKLLTRLSKEFPESPYREAYHLQLVNLMLSAQRFDEALALWRGYVQTLKEEAQLYQGTRFLADILEVSGKHDESAKVLSDFLAGHVNSNYASAVRHALARIQGASGDAAAAAATLADQVKLYPDAVASPQWRLERAKFLIEAGNSKTAISELSGLLAKPEMARFHANAVFLTAYAHEVASDMEAAQKEFAKLQGDPDPGVSAQGYLGECEAWQKRGSKEKALAAIDSCLKKITAPADVARLQAARRTIGFIGQPAPDFELPGLDGKPLSLKAARGQVVLVDFFASWCRPCYGEIPGLRRLSERRKADKFTLVGVSLDTPGSEKKLQKFMQDRGMVWRAALAGKGFESEVCQKYGVDGIPFMVVVDADGKVFSAGLRGADLDASIGFALAKVK
ncbi:MAG: redoxin domain-containing protein [Candidatus Wallbacteria bacterium]|nr:redoxin domain-containing protein [Candidatus Wallbacteria bacterium]